MLAEALRSSKSLFTSLTLLWLTCRWRPSDAEEVVQRGHILDRMARDAIAIFEGADDLEVRVRIRVRVRASQAFKG